MTRFSTTTISRLLGYVRSINNGLSSLQPLALLLARVLVARVFLLSGLTKWQGFSVSEDAIYLFQDEYFAKFALPEPVVVGLAIIAAVAEILLPLLLALGLMTRFAALGLLVMTMVIQFLVYPEAWWAVHAWWSALLIVIITFGPGAYSLDALFGKRQNR